MKLFDRNNSDADAGESAGEERRAVEVATEQALSRTRRSWFGRLASVLGASDVTEELWESLEEVLIGADAGIGATTAVLDRVRASKPADATAVRTRLREELVAVLRAAERPRGRLWVGEAGNDVGLDVEPEPPSVVLVVGVNGSGKTTAIARLAHAYRQAGTAVLCAAADTYRAAAIEQLQGWGQRLDFEVVAHRQGADSAAVAFDAIEAARARDAGVVFVDTAGRLHNRQNLMDELSKVGRVIERALGRTPDEVLLVLDATTGQNALQQARGFSEAVEVSAVMLTKLDGTARGGIVFAIAAELGLPVRFVGTGQGEDDLAPFDAGGFVDALLSGPAPAGA